MGLSEVREALRSAAPLVVVDAPAGCGKTFEAVGCAIELAAGLRDFQEVLVLAHTNAAVSEFKRRAHRAEARIHATTLDAFALGLVAPYAAALDLPSPLMPGSRPDEVPFSRLAQIGLELLKRAPSIAAAIAGHYPVVLLDEHQDTRREQHDLSMELGRNARVRIFGDPMQAIYGFGGDALVDWEAVADAANFRTTLVDPQRWAHAPELGGWILAAREALRTGARLPLEMAPPRVRVIRIGNLDDVPNPNFSGVVPAIIPALRNRLRELEGSIAVLTRSNAHVRGLYSAVRGSLVVQEGVDFGDAQAALAAAEAAIGDPAALAIAAVGLLESTCRGLNADVRSQLRASLLPNRLDRGNRRRIAPLLDALEPLYATPDLRTWCRAIESVLRRPPEWLKVDLPAGPQLLAKLRPQNGERPREALDAAVRHRQNAGPPRGSCVSTIHKAKGQEFDHVVLAHCSASPFPDTPDARRLLYVALSRARKSITLLVSGRAPSPLLQ